MISRGFASDDDLYSDKNMKRTHAEAGTAPSEFQPPSRAVPFVPDAMAPPSDNRAALHYPYDAHEPNGKRVQ